MRIDLRSDTVTKPTSGMLEAIMTADVGDDVYKEDPTVNLLEERMAAMFGKESALFFPTGSMANQAAIKLHTQPGEQLICDKYAHVYNYEGGGVSFNSGVSCRLLDGNRGMVTAAQVEEAINPPDFYHSPLTRLVCLENTTNKGGGACYDLETVAQIKGVCDANNLGLHMDGARIMNALVATGQKAADFGRLCQTITICFSKGLGTPLGTVLVGDQELMLDAIRVRKILGGGMRQIGYMAAAALYALDNNVERLSEDHKKAKELSVLLHSLEGVQNVEPVETNIVIFSVDDPDALINSLADKDIHISNMGQGKLRIVTHLDYSEPMHERVQETFISLLK
ncbi:MAG: GntG family PLP-dependent aldolase [Gilvibacter sp.]